MTLEINDVMPINRIWLRDNCRCDECYNWNAHQRKISNIQMNYEVQNYHIKGNCLQIFWNDGHISLYDIDWIKNQQQRENKPTPQIWSAEQIKAKLPFIESKDDQLTADSVRKLVTTILQLGVAVVSNVNPTIESTEKIVNYVGPVMHTIYGGMWDIDTERFLQFKDTAYTDEYLSCHTDNTYFIEPAGLQVFHCTQPAEKGGETLLLDGFKAAQLLRERNSEFYECLKNTSLQWQYISNTYHFTHVSRILNTNERSNELEQVRFNIYDRGPRIPDTCDVNLVYRSIEYFQKLLQDPVLQWKIKLQPKTVLFVNNWRVLHGRNEFHGTRKIHGCYIAMGSLLSKARKLKIIK